MKERLRQSDLALNAGDHHVLLQRLSDGFEIELMLNVLSCHWCVKE